MLDRLVFSMPAQGLQTACVPNAQNRMVVAGVTPSNSGGRSSWLLLQPQPAIATRTARLRVACNPVAWLTGQNVWGSTHVHQLVAAVVRRLRDTGTLVCGDEYYGQQVVRGSLELHEMAFALYWPCEERAHLMNVLKACWGAVVGHGRPRRGFSAHLYSGLGAIVRTPRISLCMYAKDAELALHGRVVPPGLDRCVRVETTVKHAWFGAHRRTLGQWSAGEWDRAERRIIGLGVAGSALEYWAHMPAVCSSSSYGDGWTAGHRRALAVWMGGGTVDARAARDIRHRHGLDMRWSFQGHMAVRHALAGRVDGTAGGTRLRRALPMVLTTGCTDARRAALDAQCEVSDE